jgi:hypothetical protein
MLWYAHHRELLSSLINERGANCALGGGLGIVLYVLLISPCTIINFDNQRGVAGSAGETPELRGVLYVLSAYIIGTYHCVLLS